MAEGWIKLTMKFPGKCLECGKPIPKGQPGLWSRGIGVKHVECAGTAAAGDASGISDNGAQAQDTGITCAVCSKAAGCAECELLEICDTRSVSKDCLCHGCSQKTDVLELYYKSVSSRHPALSGKPVSAAATAATTTTEKRAGPRQGTLV